MTTVLQDTISPEETIVRLLHQEWVVNGKGWKSSLDRDDTPEDALASLTTGKG